VEDRFRVVVWLHRNGYNSESVFSVDPITINAGVSIVVGSRECSVSSFLLVFCGPNWNTGTTYIAGLVAGDFC